MKRVLVLLSLLALLATPLTAQAKSDTFLVASPEVVTLNDTIDLTWGNVPTTGQDAHMEISACGTGGSIVLNLYVNSSYQINPFCTGTMVFKIVQGKKILATDSVEVQ